MPIDFLQSAKNTLNTEIRGLEELKLQLEGDAFTEACELILACQGRVVVTGMGKSGHVGRKIAATFASTGTPSFFMHPGEAGHGDLGMLVRGDVLLAISNSGDSDEISMLLPVVKRLQIPLISISRTEQGKIPAAAQVVLKLGLSAEACPLKLAPTTSSTATLALGDAIAVALLEARDFTPEDFALSHPAGALGKKLLLRVSDLMHPIEELALAKTTAKLLDVLPEMTAKQMGMVVVTKEDTPDQLGGVFTDGDLRRAIAAHTKSGNAFDQLTLAEVMTSDPMTVSDSMLASDALERMKQAKINQLVVVHPDTRQISGAVTLQDMIRAGLSV